MVVVGVGRFGERALWLGGDSELEQVTRHADSLTAESGGGGGSAGRGRGGGWGEGGVKGQGGWEGIQS